MAKKGKKVKEEAKVEAVKNEVKEEVEVEVEEEVIVKEEVKEEAKVKEEVEEEKEVEAEVKEEVKDEKEEVKEEVVEAVEVAEEVEAEVLEEVKEEVKDEKEIVSEEVIMAVEPITENKKVNIWGYVTKVSNAVLETFKRFPLTILICIALAAIAIYRIEVPYEMLQSYNEILDRIMATLALGIPLSLSINLFYERFRQSATLEKFLSYFGQLVLLLLYYEYVFVNLSMVTGVRHMGLIVSLGLTFLLMPYLNNKENYEIYITRLATKAVITVFFMAVLGAGISAILFAVKSLLYTNLSENFYAYTWIITWFVCAPIHFLHGLPKNDDVFEIEDYNKILKVLLFYIVMPIITVYTLVLYLYFGKIIVTRVWPNGIVSYLVLSYTAVLIATMFLITPLKELNNWVKKFFLIFSKLIFPLLAMMFVSIGIRIGDFGVTENRYFIVVIGIWATLAFLYINFNKGKRNILLPISLAIVAIIMVAGPLSAFNISQNSQNSRFNGILVKNNMLNSGQITKNSNIDDKDKKEIVEIIRYFQNYHNLKDLKYLPADFDISKTKDIFGFSQDDIQGFGLMNPDGYFGFGMPEMKTLETAGYDNLCKLNIFKNGLNQETFYDEKISEDLNARIKVDKNYKLSIVSNDKEIYTKDLAAIAKALNNKYGVQQKSLISDWQDAVFFDEDANANVKLIINNISGQNNVDGQINIEFIDAYVLVKIK